LKVSRLEYVAVGDPLLALKKGELDCLTFWTRTVDAVDEFRGDPRYRIKSGCSFWVLKLMFNHRIAGLDKKEVRRALAHALDLEDIARRIRHGHATAGNPGFVPPQSPWYKNPKNKYPYDLDCARAILQTVGCSDKNGDGILEDESGKPLSFTLLSAREYVREAEYVSSQAKKIGIKIAVKALPFQTLDAFLKKGDYEIAINGHGGIGGDPDYLKRYFCADNPDVPAAFQAVDGYENPELNRLAEAQRLENNPDKRRAIIDRMQEIIAEEMPVISLWYPKIYFAYKPDVAEGWFWTPGGIGIGIPTFDNKLVYLERRLR